MATSTADVRPLTEQAFSRSAGADLIEGNAVRVLRNAAENYPAWERAIAAATATIHVEMYIIHRDDVGRRFIAGLAERASAGVKVRLLYDWFGCGFGPALGLFRPLTRAGGEVRAFNPPRLTPALGWIRRNHRKLITVDGRVAFSGGLCVGAMWSGNPGRGHDPWRDTGIELRGPAVAHAERSFARTWALAGDPLDAAVVPDPDDIPRAGNVGLRLIPTEPFTAQMLRTDFLIVGLARRSLWISDAYFLDHGPYIDALRLAAQDGVDVRILLPHGSDVGLTVTMSRSLYQDLIESGVRVFEWNGSMMHAKTAVADSRWARIGSTNLNLNSWIGNWELDVAIEDEEVARTLEAHYEEDMAHATEIHADGSRPPERSRPRPPRHHGSTKILRRVGRVSRSLGAAVTGRRALGIYESVPLVIFGVLLVLFAVLLFWKPAGVSRVFGVLAAWLGASVIVESLKTRRQKSSDES